MEREKYMIEISRPDGVTVSELKEYMEIAILSWAGGSGYPDDPLLKIKDRPLKIRRMKP